jgi:cytochrome d ubiquinol oxidase subunit II
VTIDLQTAWYLLVGVLFTGYAVLDGFDLGVGAIHLFAKTDQERRLMLNAIGPVWDGNEVWLVTGGGALFAAFPEAYATVLSGFYLGFMLFVVSLIFRACAIEFRSKRPEPVWRAVWDFGFSASSVLSSFLIGLVLGNLIWGVQLGPDREYHGTLLDLFHPYSIAVGVMTVALFAMHGAIYIVLKTEGELQQKARGWVRNAIITFTILYALVTMMTLLYVPHMTEHIRKEPMFFVVAIAGLMAVANVPREIHHGREFAAFLSSCAAMVALMALFGIGIYPNLVYSNPNPEWSLTIAKAASSEKTLGIMLICALIGMPLVIGYTATIYWIFRGKVKLDSSSY